MSFVGLHIHSDYSLLDGASQLPQLIDRAVQLGMPAIALTDHGVMYGAIQLIKLCRNKGIKPIIGNEMYVINGDIEKQQRGKKFHQVVLAKNTQGYKNLVKLTTLSHLQGFQGNSLFGRPCINKELLEKYHEGLIVTSGCLAGEVPQNIMQGKLDEAKKVAKWYKDLFGEDYYLEIQDHGSREDRVVNTGIVKISERLKIKIVATNDSHFISCRDVEAHDALLCINTKKLITQEKRMRYSGTEYLKSAEEMKQLFRDHLENEVIEEAIANTLEVANKVEKYEGILGEPRIPDYPIPPEHNADTYLEELSWQGLLERLKRQQRSEISAVYKERMETELKVLQDKGFSTYFLVVWDYIKYARDANIPVGPGRGSAAGSLVAYSLRITNIDPVHHGLLFERFLNPERKSMPDIDTDFCIENRDAMIDYVTERYGEERVAQIITFNRMTSKAVLKDVARALGVSFGEADKMAKLIPVARGKPAKLKVMISNETPAPEFKEAYENNEIQIEDNEGGIFNKVSVQQWIDMAIRIEGTNKTFGVHAAGVVISKEPLDEIVPLQRNNDGSVITQYHMEDIESLGLLKMDFLGLKNLTIIQNTADLIEKNYNPPFPLIPDDLPALERKAIIAKQSRGEMPEDVEKTYDLLKSGDLEGVFQLESSGMVDVVKKLKPSSIEDISSILALYRPGPLDAGLIPKFIDRKHGREEIKYQHPKLEPILQETYGVLCLPKGTLIDKPDGSRVAIENIKSGEVILTSDGRKVWQAKVARQWRSGVKEILKITLSSGTVIYSGKNHRFLTPEGDKFAWELEPGVKNGNIYGSVVYEKWQVSSNQKKTNSWSRKNQDYSQEKATLFKAKNLSDIAKLENWEKSRENYLQISSLSLVTDSENLISQTNISTQKNQKFSLSKPTFNLSDIAKLENWEKSRENYLQISSLSLATDSINSISQTNSLSGKNQKSSRQRAILFKPTNLSEKTNLKNGEESNQEIYEKTHLQDVRLVYVISVEEAGKAECFDLEMEDQNSPYFLAEGVVVHNCYQEQIMKMAQDLAGYSLGEADLLRRAMGKKKVAEMEKHREIFIDGATQRGVQSAVAEDLFEQMIKFAEYCFNKSHSTAYAYVAYQTAYLKANYPLEYMAALLTANSGDQDKVQKYIANCQKFNIKVELPNINLSQVHFTPSPKAITGEEKDKIIFGLSAVNAVGEVAVKAILKAREKDGLFKSFVDFCERVNLNTKVLTALIQCGAFDQIENNRKQLIENLKDVIEWGQKRRKEKEGGQLNLFDTNKTEVSAFEFVSKRDFVPDFSVREKLNHERETLGFYVSDHPLKYVQEQTQIQDAISIAEMKEKKSNSKVKVVVMLIGIKPHVTKKGDRMAFLQVEDMTGQVDAVVFPKVYEKIKDLLTENAILILSGKVDNKDDESQLLVDSAEAVEKVMANAVEQQKKLEMELDYYQYEQKDEEVKIYQSIPEFEKPVEELDNQKKSLKKDTESRDKEVKINQSIPGIEKPGEKLEIQTNHFKKDADSLIAENGFAKPKQIIILQLPVDKIPENDSLFEDIKAILKEQSSGDEAKAKVVIGALIYDQKEQKYVEFNRQFWVENGETTINTINSLKAIGIQAEIREKNVNLQ
ncbi:DNA polymerase III subunit alpha [Okeania sp. SIO1I7]|uniref:DNA polymerase III subunit alpha n=1 Tax=Okeania sp. SIO1I7 TaxID=2607772 RepID=UPI0025E5E96A|nr:DNA polymerase III subunit alpha [Okeania sp. SIO1I7]